MARTTNRQLDKGTPSRIKGQVVKPNYMLRLMEHVGPKAAADLIGTTPGTLHKARNAGFVTPSIEVAARGVWKEKGFGAEESNAAPARPTTDMHQAVSSPHNEGTSLFLIQVAKERAAILERTAEALGATVISQA